LCTVAALVTTSGTAIRDISIAVLVALIARTLIRWRRGTREFEIVAVNRSDC